MATWLPPLSPHLLKCHVLSETLPTISGTFYLSSWLIFPLTFISVTQYRLVCDLPKVEGLFCLTDKLLKHLEYSICLIKIKKDNN